MSGGEPPALSIVWADSDQGLRRRAAASAGLLAIGIAPWVVAGLVAGGDPAQSQGLDHMLAQAQRQPSFAFFLTTNIVPLAAAMSGVVLFGLPTIVVLLLCGARIGGDWAAASGAGIPAPVLAAAVLPHGIPEVLALCLAGSIGLSGLRSTADAAAGRAVRIVVHGRTIAGSAAAALALLALAAYLESHVTGQVVQTAISGVRER